MRQSNESQEAILTTLASIPYGKVCTYGLVADLAGQKGKARLVGFILKKLPASSSIPWHRVVNSQGRSSFAINSIQQQTQLSKLERENIPNNSGKISLKKHLWHGL
jgi:methylated-DNA-protein-cysteine methyltransferase-like protein